MTAWKIFTSFVTIKRLSAILGLIRPAIKKKAFDRGNVRLRTANRRVSFARDADLARQTLATLPFTKQREMDSAASALGGFRRSGAPEADYEQDDEGDSHGPGPDKTEPSPAADFARRMEGHRTGLKKGLSSNLAKFRPRVGSTLEQLPKVL